MSLSGMRVGPGGNVARFLDGTLVGAPLGYPTVRRHPWVTAFSCHPTGQPSANPLKANLRGEVPPRHRGIMVYRGACFGRCGIRAPTICPEHPGERVGPCCNANVGPPKLEGEFVARLHSQSVAHCLRDGDLSLRRNLGSADGGYTRILLTSCCALH